MRDRRRYIIQLMIYLFVIVYVTLLSRTPMLNRVTKLQPFWSYAMLLKGKMTYARQIVLNIILFIPFGFFLSASFQPLWACLIAFGASAIIEIIQFATYRGMLDVDDLFSNVLGAIIGVLFWKLVKRQKEKKKIKLVSDVLLVAGVIGVLIVAVPDKQSIIDSRLTQQFNFEIETRISHGNIVINGLCYTYERPTLPYVIMIDDTDIVPETNGKKFSLSVVPPENKVEIKVRFQGYEPIKTGTWLCPDGKIDYVAEDVISPRGVPNGAELKAYSSAFDTYVYENQGKILWLIGWEQLDKNTEVIFQLNTDEPEKLPEYRKQYGFDNRGFHVKAGNTIMSEYELERIGNYRVFEQKIPNEYNVVSILVGFNTDGIITWRQSFRPSWKAE
ncbi:MAG: VanZ family protein [Lachnospiraceae bacterium]|nr:VanZ family protein [Lachnospiraceae bacterium]